MKTLNKISDLIMFTGILIFSFYLTLKAGSRGFFAIVFDGAYRIFSGQIPYKDFLIPFGPMVFWIQAIFFKIFGVNYFSYIVSGASINLLSTACSMLILRCLSPSRRRLSYLAGLLTAVWFYPPFGTLWPEQTAFFFSLLSITLLLFALVIKKSSVISHVLFLFLSGIFAFFSCISKQNVGIFIFPLYFLLLIAYFSNYKRILYSSGIFLAGFIGSLIVFLQWLLLRSDIENFLKYFIDIPTDIGFRRLIGDEIWFGDKFGLINTFSGGNCCPLPIHILPICIKLASLIPFFIAIAMLILSISNFEKIRDTWKQTFISCIICIYLVGFQYLFIHSTFNQAENGVPFIGIILAIGTGLFFYSANNISLTIQIPEQKLLLPSKRLVKITLAGVICWIALYVGIYGIKVSLTREIHEFKDSIFTESLYVKGLKDLKWGNPTKIGMANIKRDEIVNLFIYLKKDGKNFFIFPDFTIFYAMLNVPSPQPVLWFHKGLTYPELYDPSLDKWVVKNLKKNMVETIILEEASWFGTTNRLDDFPMVRHYVSKNFSKVEQIGMFHIYKKNKD
ncbi:MAG: glycosyltransferase family 39 protein [bacterium]|nr:glycosyltransferase family 39 protein [bacterium]